MNRMNYTLLLISIFMLQLFFPVTSDSAQSNKTWKDPVTGMEFISIPGGSFKMGCGAWTSECEEDEKPVHTVRISNFLLGKYEVTQGQWKAIMGNNPSHFPKGDTYPVEKISWSDAKEFIQKLNERSTAKFRLPTEAEWEYAARSGGKPEKYSGGDKLGQVGWYLDNSGITTHPVGTKAPNGLGLYDMTGNVWEWVEDAKSQYSPTPQDNPVVRDGSPSRIFRGGSWSYGPEGVRTSGRGEYSPLGRSSNLGLRLVRIN